MKLCNAILDVFYTKVQYTFRVLYQPPTKEQYTFPSIVPTTYPNNLSLHYLHPYARGITSLSDISVRYHQLP